MDIEICDEFIYRINNRNIDLFNEFNTCKENVLRNNSNLKIYPGEWVKIKVNDYVVHCVKPAETIYEIAKKHSLTIDELKLNNNLNSNKLFIGQMLKIYKKKNPL